MKRVSLIGCTGSIGTQSADVIRSRGYSLTAIAANTNVAVTERQAREFKPKIAAMFSEDAAKQLKLALADTDIKVLAGEQGVQEAAAADTDIVVNSVVGIAGLSSTIAAIKAGHTLALANKESLVCAGDIVMNMAEANRVDILPVDSEHSAVFQCLGSHKNDEIEKIILTASGGPFYGYSADQLCDVTPEQALKHPSWNMGSKITIDSATMMNKGFELMEAKYLFGVTPDKLGYVVHRESLVHSMVQFADGALLAQISPPDMRLPIVYALDYPVRYKTDFKRYDPCTMPISFLPPRDDVFKAPSLCIKALEMGGNAGAIVNGANEAAVALFLNKKIRFTDITDFARQALENVPFVEHPSLDDIYSSDKAARAFVYSKVVI
ncbi:MAG: 1-deoxy-D-xylulose-5-phosphate reductoisomerase [Clostridia bacterium]|nr:1-deoxy-D-xylulose-5-phosphate reductoisomerase [Clostridia bacterium]